MKLKLLKWLYKPFIYSRYYKYWSKLYRFLFQRKYKNIKLNKYSSLKEMEKDLDLLTWRKDGPKELWDVQTSPQWVQYCLNEIKKGNSQPSGPLDCDDFCSFIYSTFFNLESSILSVSYLKNDNKLSGHMVYLDCPDGCSLYHVSNWGVFGPYSTYEDVLRSIVGEYKYIGHTEYDGNLNPLLVDTKGI